MGAGVAWLLLIGYAERNLAGTRLWIAGASFDAGNLKPGAIVRQSGVGDQPQSTLS
jgi:hypothetical protein